MKVFKCEYCNNNYRGNYKSHFCDKQLVNLTGNIKKRIKDGRKLSTTLSSQSSEPTTPGN